TQLRRQAALPQAMALQTAMSDALRGLPFREGLFSPFLQDIERARTGKLIGLSDLHGSALALKIRSLLLQNGDEWVALMPLRGVDNARQLAEHIRAANMPGAL